MQRKREREGKRGEGESVGKKELVEGLNKTSASKKKAHHKTEFQLRPDPETIGVHLWRLVSMSKSKKKEREKRKEQVNKADIVLFKSGI